MWKMSSNFSSVHIVVSPFPRNFVCVGINFTFLFLEVVVKGVIRVSGCNTPGSYIYFGVTFNDKIIICHMLTWK